MNVDNSEGLHVKRDHSICLKFLTREVLIPKNLNLDEALVCSGVREEELFDVHLHIEGTEVDGALLGLRKLDVFTVGLEVGLRLSPLDLHIHIEVDLLKSIIQLLDSFQEVLFCSNRDECRIEGRLECEDGVLSDRERSI